MLNIETLFDPENLPRHSRVDAMVYIQPSFNKKEIFAERYHKPFDLPYRPTNLFKNAIMLKISFFRGWFPDPINGLQPWKFFMFSSKHRFHGPDNFFRSFNPQFLQDTLKKNYV